MQSDQDIFFKEDLSCDSNTVIVQCQTITTASNIDIEGLELQGLSETEKEAVRRLLTKYSDVFAKNDSDLGCTTLIDHESR